MFRGSVNAKYAKEEITAFLAIILFILLFFKPVPAGDGFGYYALLQSIGRDHSLSLENQQWCTEKSHMGCISYINATGKYVNNRAFGFPLLSLPLYEASLILDKFSIFHIKDNFFIEERGDILIHTASMSLTTLLMVIVALVLSLKIIKEKYSQKTAALAVLIAFFSSPMLKYATYDSSYTHGVEAGLLTIITFLVLKDSNPLLIGGLMGLLSIVRYTSAAFIIPLLLYYSYYKRYSDAAKILAGALPFIASVLLYWNAQFGSPFDSGYSQQQQFSITHLPENALRIIFDFDRGILFWSPNLLIAVAGLFLIKDSKKWLFITWILSYLLIYGAYGGDWHSGVAFGNRWFVVFFPLFAIGMSLMLEKYPKLKLPAILLSIHTLFLFILFITFPLDSQNLSDILNYWINDGHISSLLEELIKKITLIRFIFEY